MNSSMKFYLGSVIKKVGHYDSSKEKYIDRVVNYEIDFETYEFLVNNAQSVSVTPRFADVIETFGVEPNITPAGFRIEFSVNAENVLMVDLVRDINYGENGLKRPTQFIYSADSANPYEIQPIKGLLGNLTCNPGIIYDLFLNNPKANINNAFKTRDEVMEEIGNVLGPGCDISVELNNPYADIEEILEEAARFREMLSEYRVVIKVPHTGPINDKSVHQLLEGDKKFDSRYNKGTTEDFLRGHNVALRLKEEGYRINFTLMFEPYQTALALQAKPYFINSFVRHRLKQSKYIIGLLNAFKSSQNIGFLEQLKSYMLDNDYFSSKEQDVDLLSVLEMAENIASYRNIDNAEGSDGLDSVRHNLRMLKHSNLDDTRLIICSMEGPQNYPDIDRLLTEKEFEDMTDRVVITAEPNYLAQFTSTNQVITYQRRFMNAANGAK